MTSPDAQLAPRVLVALDDLERRTAVATELREAGFSVSSTVDATAALLLLQSFGPDVVVVDVRLAPVDGGSLFDRVRETSAGYVIAVAPADDMARIRVLRAGADDAVTPDVHPGELAARCHALLRRPRGLNRRWDPLGSSTMTIGPVSMDVGRRELTVFGQPVVTTRLEFDVFEQLCRRPTVVQSRAQLLREVWGPSWVGDDHVVDVHLSNLRRKLQRHGPGLRCIETVRGVGFRLGSDLLAAHAASTDLECCA